MILGINLISNIQVDIHNLIKKSEDNIHSIVKNIIHKKY